MSPKIFEGISSGMHPEVHVGDPPRIPPGILPWSLLEIYTVIPPGISSPAEITAIVFLKPVPNGASFFPAIPLGTLWETHGGIS